MKTLISAFLLLLISNIASSLFFQNTQYVPASCPSGFSRTSLQDMATNMANRSRENIFQNLLPNILVPRVPDSQGSLLVRQFIKQEMGRLGWAVEEDTFVDVTPLGNMTFSNVIATFNPTQTRRIVIACHYDSKLMQGTTPFVAATDSGVPCALMLDSARQLADMAANARDNQLSYFSFQFIFFDGEEALVRWTSTDSLYGSRHLAEKWAAERDMNDRRPVNKLYNIELFVLLDLIGTYDTRFVNHFYATASHFNTLASIEQCLSELGFLATPYQRTIFDRYGAPSFIQDDHIPFLQRGVPILHLISTPFPSVWHTTNDDLAHLDVNTIDDFSRIFRLYLARLLVGL